MMQSKSVQKIATQTLPFGCIQFRKIMVSQRWRWAIKTPSSLRFEDFIRSFHFPLQKIWFNRGQFTCYPRNVKRNIGKLLTKNIITKSKPINLANFAMLFACLSFFLVVSISGYKRLWSQYFACGWTDTMKTKLKCQ